ncbi:MAG: hypothetical protein IKU07_07850 [Oscillospiraceae bacterium]|nr:hypothetical protein [Oscillospiraceae bacterium]
MNHKNERVIYIKDMLFAVLYRWRAVLIVALALALLLGGYRMVSLLGSSVDPEAAQKAQESYELQAETLSQQVTALEEKVEAFSTYLNESPFMELNPHSVYIYEMNIYLEAPTAEGTGIIASDPADSLLGIYRKQLMSEENLNAVATASSLEGKCMDAILDVNSDYTANLLTIIVRHINAEAADAVFAALETIVNDTCGKVTQIVGAHNMSVVNTSVFLRNDADLAQLQTKRSEELLKLKDTLKTRTAEQSALVAPAVPPVTTAQILVSAIKYAILGGVLGCFAVAFVVVLLHLGRAKVYSRRTLEDQTGLTVLGCIPGTKKYNAIDRWLRKLEGRSTEAPEACCALIAARIRTLCGENGALLITGKTGAQERLPMLDALEAAGCKVIANGDLLTNIDTAKALADATCVILIEQCGKSLYATALEATELVEATEKPVLGCILVEG